MTQSTRDQLLSTARRRFAERGFYGVSIAQIADEHGLTKQALLHHFPTKEKLYGEVLKSIADELDGLMAAAQAASDDPKAQLKTLFQSMILTTDDNVMRTRLLMRELLDNKHRAETAGAWYLKGFLNNGMRIAQAIPGWSDVSDAQAMAVMYQLLGAVSYYGVSGPTLQGIFGKTGANAVKRSYPVQFDAMIEAAFAAPPPASR